MKIGLQIPIFSWPGQPGNTGSTLIEIAQAAEHAGFSSLWVMDHFFQLGAPWGEADEPMYEGYSTLAFLAGVTQRIKLGTLVTGVIYREPGFLVKTVTTLDVLSGGRAYFGVGAGWYEREALGLGFRFPPLKERFERLEETLQIAYKMWSGDRSPFEGKYYHLAEPITSPLPLSRPHPPIMIGGGGEKKTLRLVAQYADACNLFMFTDRIDEIAHKLNILKQHCDDLGRDYNAIERTVLGTAPATMSAAEIVGLCRKLTDIGIQHVIFNMPGTVHQITPLETFGREIIPAVAGF